MYASLMEDDSDGPGVATSFGPVPSLHDGAGSAPGCSRQQQLSCVYVWSILPPPPPIPDIPSLFRPRRRQRAPDLTMIAAPEPRPRTIVPTIGSSPGPPSSGTATTA